MKSKPPSQLFYEINKYCEKNREMRYNRTKVHQTRKIKGNFWKWKLYGVLLTFSPAAASTLLHYFEDTNTTPHDYDVIYTGDLGYIGTQLLYKLTDEKGVDLRCKHSDCGNMIFDREKQDVHGGGSGCGCSASVLASFIMHRFEDGNFKNILFMSTGALLSPTSTMQGESIPGIAHLLNIRKD